jgi:hypothetical protein
MSPTRRWLCADRTFADFGGTLVFTRRWAASCGARVKPIQREPASEYRHSVPIYFFHFYHGQPEINQEGKNCGQACRLERSGRAAA